MSNQKAAQPRPAVEPFMPTPEEQRAKLNEIRDTLASRAFTLDFDLELLEAQFDGQDPRRERYFDLGGGHIKKMSIAERLKDLRESRDNCYLGARIAQQKIDALTASEEAV